MVQILDTTMEMAGDAALNAMFLARKSVFVDLLKWDVPVRDGCHECQSARKRDPRSASNKDPLMRMRDFPSL